MTLPLRPSDLLGDMPLGQFLQDHWRKRPLFRPAPHAQRFAHLLDRDSLLRCAPRCDNLKVARPDLLGRSIAVPCGAAELQRAYDTGATVCASGINGHAPLDQFMAAFAQWMPQAGDLSFNAYWSPAGQGFSLHVDDHPVWILQLDGSKHWSFTTRPDPLLRLDPADDRTPMLAHGLVPGPTPPLPVNPELESVTLHPGDVLYLPEGCWHQAAAQGHSLALTLACNRVTPLDLVQRLLGPELAAQTVMRCNLSDWATALHVAMSEQREDNPGGTLDATLNCALDVLKRRVAALTVDEMRAILKQMAAR